MRAVYYTILACTVVVLSLAMLTLFAISDLYDWMTDA